MTILNTNTGQNISIKSIRHLSILIQTDLSILKDLYRLGDSAYTERKELKKNGGTRTIVNPCDRLKKVQKRIHSKILKKIAVHPNAHGSVSNRSHITAASVHLGRSYLRTIDLKNCFDTVTSGAIYKILISLDCSADVSRMLTRLVTYKGKLPQGAPTSPYLLNLFLKQFDSILTNIATKKGVEVSRVVDDIQISGQENAAEEVHEIAHSLIKRMRLQVNRKKIHGSSNQFLQEICGIGVNRRPVICNEYRKKVRETVRKLLRYGASKKELDSVIGKIKYISKLHPIPAEKMLASLTTLRNISIKSSNSKNQT